MNRRLLFLIALIVILAGVAVAVLLGSQGGGGTAQPQDTPAVVVTDDSGVRVTQAPRATDVPTVDVVIAVQPIGRGQTITDNMVDFRTYPEELVPASALFSLEDVVGKIARVDIPRETYIVVSQLTENLSDLGATGSDAGAVLPPGTRLIAVPMDRLTSVGYAIQPGDRVDIILSLLYVDLDEDFQSVLPNQFYPVEEAVQNPDGTFSLQFGSPVELGRLGPLPFGQFTLLVNEVPREERRPRLTTQMTITDALVVGVGDFPIDGRLFEAPTPIGLPTVEVTAAPAANARPSGTAVPTPVPQRPDIAALAVTPQEAVTIVYMIESRVPITFVLRPANETSSPPTTPATLDFIMQTYSITVPARRPYGVEPAIRSIRQLIGGEIIRLNTSSIEGEDSSTGN